MKPGDVVSYRSGADNEEYIGVVNWAHEDEIGVTIISPTYVEGASEVLNIKEDEPKVVSHPTRYLKRDLSQFSVEELRAEIEQLRSARSARVSTPSKAGISGSDKAILDKLSTLSSDELDKLLKE